MRTEQNEVGDFHRKFNFPIGRDLRQEPDGVFTLGPMLKIMAKGLVPIAIEQGEQGDERMRRCQLMLEELGELIEALEAKDPVAAADATGDLLYVVLGTCETYEIPAEECFTAIHASNMSKTRDPDDPRMKAKDPARGYFKADLAHVLRTHTSHYKDI